MRLVLSPNEVIFESSSREERSLENYQLATCTHVYLRVLYSVQTLCQFCNTKWNQQRRCLNWCTARRCLRCWQVRQYVTVNAPSLGILTNQDTASAHACFSISYSWHFDTCTASSNTLKSKILGFLFICFLLKVSWCRCYRSKFFDTFILVSLIVCWRSSVQNVLNRGKFENNEATLYKLFVVILHLELQERFLGAFAKLRKSTTSFVLSFVHQSLRPAAWNSLVPIGRIFMKF